MTKKNFPLKKEMGQRFRLFRKHLGKTQKTLAGELGIRQSNIARIEMGVISPSMYACYRLKEDYYLNVNWLLSGSGDMILKEKERKDDGPVDYEEFTEEMQDLFYHLDNVPEIRHEVLKYFFNYKLANKKRIMEFLAMKEKKDA